MLSTWRLRPIHVRTLSERFAENGVLPFPLTHRNDRRCQQQAFKREMFDLKGAVHTSI